MNATASTSHQIRSLLKPILAGGLAAGSLDLTSAFIIFGSGVPRVIAGGLLGRQAFQGGAGIWVLGVILHYFIAFLAASIYCLASLKLDFLRRHFVVCGLYYGIAVYLVMNLIVLPLSGLHTAGPFKLKGLLQGLLVHMFLIGLPIAVSLRRLSIQEQLS
jgi:hypothetical protein